MQLKQDILKLVNEYNNRIEKKTNVLFLTSECNFNCAYCFEKEKRKKLKIDEHISIEDIHKFLSDIEWREEGLNSTIVLFGGEPLLRFNEIQYIMEYIKRSKKSGGWGISLTTNGFYLKNKNILNKIMEYSSDELKNKNIYFKLAISFDCSGHILRTKISDNKSSYDEILSNIYLLDDNNIPYDISYTITHKNYNMVKRDLVFMCNNFNNLSRIIINYAISYLEDNLGKSFNLNEYKTLLKPFHEAIFMKYKKPICDEVCNICKICNKIEKCNSYMSPIKGHMDKNKKINEKFNMF